MVLTHRSELGRRYTDTTKEVGGGRGGVKEEVPHPLISRVNLLQQRKSRVRGQEHVLINPLPG